MIQILFYSMIACGDDTKPTAIKKEVTKKEPKKEVTKEEVKKEALEEEAKPDYIDLDKDLAFEADAMDLIEAAKLFRLNIFSHKILDKYSKGRKFSIENAKSAITNTRFQVRTEKQTLVNSMNMTKPYGKHMKKTTLTLFLIKEVLLKLSHLMYLIVKV